MKVLLVVILLVVSAILSRGPGVPTQGSSVLTNNNTEVLPVADVNQNTLSQEAKSLNVNPPHGQPGHRCDIGVGKPLPVGSTTTDTKPAKRFNVPVIDPALKSATAPAINTSTATQPANGLNPPHGQPGHRCDIKVGQPLNGQPAQAATTTTTTPSTVPTISNTNPASNTTNVASGLNPKHGQPGHRCDIMVGQPLNSKPAQPAAATAPVQSANTVQSATTTTTPAIWSAPSATTAVPKTTAGSPKLNPKHGQPGHRCDILVGQPLDSKPAQ